MPDLFISSLAVLSLSLSLYVPRCDLRGNTMLYVCLFIRCLSLYSRAQSRAACGTYFALRLIGGKERLQREIERRERALMNAEN